MRELQHQNGMHCRAEFQMPEVDGVDYIEKGKAFPGAMVAARITRGLTYDLVGEMG